MIIIIIIWLPLLDIEYEISRARVGVIVMCRQEELLLAPCKAALPVIKVFQSSRYGTDSVVCLYFAMLAGLSSFDYS